jgi:hypothetical protein
MYQADVTCAMEVAEMRPLAAQLIAADEAGRATRGGRSEEGRQAMRDGATGTAVQPRTER